MKEDPRKQKDSGISDLDGALRRKVREARGSYPMDDKREFTPITNLTDLGPAISAIKRGQDRTADAVDNLDRMVRREMKPQLNEVRDGFIRLETEHKSTKKRLRDLEVDTKEVLTAPLAAHDCYHEDDIRDLEEGHRGTMAEIAVVKTDVAAVQASHLSTKEILDKDVGRIDGRSKTITGVAVTVTLFVLASIGGAAAAFYSTQANVSHLSQEQTKIRDEVSKMRSASVSASSKVELAVERVERMADSVEKSGIVPDPLKNIWCDLSPMERRRQIRLRGAEKVPQRRCP